MLDESKKQVIRDNVDAVNAVFKILKNDMRYLYMEELGAIRAFLEAAGLKLPPKPKEEEEREVKEEEGDAEVKMEEEKEEEKEKSVEESESSEEESDAEEEEEEEAFDSPPYPEIPPEQEYTDELGEKSQDAKQRAQEKAESGDYQAAADLLTESLRCQWSGLTLARRAEYLLKANRPNACIHDCNEALRHNPDSVRALKIRGRAYKLKKKWVEAAVDLRKACGIDFDEETDQERKAVEGFAQEIEAARRKKRLAREEKEERKKEEVRRKFAERTKREREQREREAEERRNMPQDDGYLHGAPGSMDDLMRDKDFMDGMQNPKIREMMMNGMNDPVKLQEYMQDPECREFMARLQSKFANQSQE